MIPGLRATAAALGAIALLAVAACGADGPTAPEPTATGPAEYVALGDSYTAVSGAGPFADEDCYRSEDGYPGLVAKELGYAPFVNASCGGASSESLTSAQYLSGVGKNPPQLDSVAPTTKVVTLGIGLNDDKTAGAVLLSCLGTTAANKTCKQYLDAPPTEVDALYTRLDKIGDLVSQDLADVKKAAPNARVVLVGYPRVLGDKACPSQLPLPKVAAARYRTASVRINDALKNAAQQAGVDFVDMYAASTGHELCSADPWIDGQHDVVGEAFAFHPYPAYHEAVAAKIVALLSKK